MERLNLDDYNSDDYDEYLSDNMETTPAVAEVEAVINQDLPAPPPVVTVTVQLEEQPTVEDLYERHRLLNQRRSYVHFFACSLVFSFVFQLWVPADHNLPKLVELD